MVSCLMGDSTALASAIVRCCLIILNNSPAIAAIINDYANIIPKQYLGLCTVPFLIEIDFFHYHRSK